MSYNVDTVIKNATYTVGEAPHWEGDTDTLLFVDLLAGNLHRYNTLTKIEERRHFDLPVTLVVPRQSGGYIITNRNSLKHLDWQSGSLTNLATIQKYSFNDGKCDEAGRLWAGSLGTVVSPMTPEFEAGILYSLEKGLTVKNHADKVTISNGMGWSPDNTKMYYVDSFIRTIWAFDFNLETGTASNRQGLIKITEEESKTMGFPDGMTTDVEGKLWVAFFKGSSIIRFDPQTGKEISRVKFPTSQITSCCWGGRNYDELYVTSGSVDIKDEDAKGSIFKVTNTGTRGKPAPVFMG